MRIPRSSSYNIREALVTAIGHYRTGVSMLYHFDDGDQRVIIQFFFFFFFPGFPELDTAISTENRRRGSPENAYCLPDVFACVSTIFRCQCCTITLYAHLHTRYHNVFSYHSSTNLYAIDRSIGSSPCRCVEVPERYQSLRFPRSRDPQE